MPATSGIPITGGGSDERSADKSICLYTRIRRNHDDPSLCHWTVKDDPNGHAASWVECGGKGGFLVDRVFEGPDQGQVAIEVCPIIEDCVKNGVNATVLVYGQTGSGKTYTIFGPDSHLIGRSSQMSGGLGSVQHPGLVPALLDMIFQLKEKSAPSMDVTMKLAMFEIYQEQLKDLLEPDPTKRLTIFENSFEGVKVRGLSEEFPQTPSECWKTMCRGLGNRTIGETRMNQYSSRSHTIVNVRLTSTDVSTNASTVCDLNFVDLAGSEKVAKTGAQGERFDEAKMINKSLTTLGLVINCLADQSKSNKKMTRDHVPYRDSKLTRALKNSLGGNAKTVLITTISDRISDTEESLGTLRFGQRAQLVQNKIVANKKLAPAELERMISVLTRENGALKTQIKTLEQLCQLHNIDYLDRALQANSSFALPTAPSPTAATAAKNPHQPSSSVETPSKTSDDFLSPILDASILCVDPSAPILMPSQDDTNEGNSGTSTLLSLLERESRLEQEKAALESQQRDVEDMVDTILTLQASLAQREEQLRKIRDSGNGVIDRLGESSTTCTGATLPMLSPIAFTPSPALFESSIMESVNTQILEVEAMQCELTATAAERDYYSEAYGKLKLKYETVLRTLIDDEHTP